MPESDLQEWFANLELASPSQGGKNTAHVVILDRTLQYIASKQFPWAQSAVRCCVAGYTDTRPVAKPNADKVAEEAKKRNGQKKKIVKTGSTMRK